MFIKENIEILNDTVSFGQNVASGVLTPGFSFQLHQSVTLIYSISLPLGLP